MKLINNIVKACGVYIFSICEENDLYTEIEEFRVNNKQNFVDLRVTLSTYNSIF